MILDSLSQHQHYSRLLPALADGFAFLLERANLALADGRHEIDGQRIYAAVTSYDTRPADAFEPEAHRRYLDIQFLISGRESIVWTPLDECGEVSIPYSDEKDIVFFRRNARGRAFELAAGHFAIFWPHDVHQPGCHLDGSGPVKKVIVKVAV